VVFDFDSTLIDCESLEAILASRLTADERARIARITAAGMRGELAFAESLARRLAVARPRRQEVKAFVRELPDHLTSGMDTLISSLISGGHEVWIVSGGFREVVLPLAEQLGVPADHVLAVQPVWAEDGRFAGLKPDDPMAQQKWQGVEAAQAEGRPWPRPAVAVGDGMTDHELWAHGLVDHFVAYTEHARREAVVTAAGFEAADAKELARILERLC